MPRFYFDTDDGDVTTRDVYGIELSDQAAARHAAVDTLPDIARATLPDGDQRTMCVRVRDETGRQILLATLRLDVEWTSLEREPSITTA